MLNQEKPDKTSEAFLQYGRFSENIDLWTYLAIEVALFALLFVYYLVSRINHSDIFGLFVRDLDFVVASVNGLIMVTSGLTVTLSLVALNRSQKGSFLTFIIISILLGLAFIILSGGSYMKLIGSGLFPGSDILTERGSGYNIFFGLYYLMFGFQWLQAVSVVVIFLIMLFFVLPKDIDQINRLTFLKLTYFWNMTVILWLFTFPLFFIN